MKLWKCLNIHSSHKLIFYWFYRMGCSSIISLDRPTIVCKHSGNPTALIANFHMLLMYQVPYVANNAGTRPCTTNTVQVRELGGPDPVLCDQRRRKPAPGRAEQYCTRRAQWPRICSFHCCSSCVNQSSVEYPRPRLTGGHLLSNHKL